MSGMALLTPLMNPNTVHSSNMTRRSGLKPFIQEAKRNQDPKKVKPYDLAVRREIDSELTHRTIDFMERQAKAGKPFFAFVPLTKYICLPSPIPISPERTGNGDFADSVAEMDHNIGEMLDTLDRLGIREDTIVIFASDNGPEEVAAYPRHIGLLARSLFHCP